MNCTIRVAKTKALISCTVTAQLICVFVFSYAKTRFSHNAAHMASETSLVARGCEFNPRPLQSCG